MVLEAVGTDNAKYAGKECGLLNYIFTDIRP